MVLYCCFGVKYIFMSVNIAERPTFEQRTVHFDRGVCKRNYFHFEGRILYLIVSVRMVTVYQCDSIEINL